MRGHRTRSCRRDEVPRPPLPGRSLRDKRPGQIAAVGDQRNSPIEILAEAEVLADASGLVFPSPRGKVLSDMTLSKLAKEHGFKADIHGF